jgi:hypothetical protein
MKARHRVERWRAKKAPQVESAETFSLNQAGDFVPLSVALYNAVLWMGAFEALEQMAQHKNESALANRVAAALNKTRQITEQTLWNEKYGFYQYNSRRDALRLTLHWASVLWT